MELLSRGYGRLLLAMALVGAALIFTIVVLISFNVTARALGGNGILWTDEVSEYSLYLLTLLSAPWLLRKAAHVRVDVVLMSVPPHIGWLLELFGALAGLTVSLVFVWYSTAAAIDSWRIGAMTIKSLMFPEWWLIAPMPGAFALISIEFVFLFWRVANGSRQPSVSGGGAI